MSLTGIYDLLLEGVEMTFNYILDPEKRIYYLYLTSSLILAFYVYVKTNKKSSFISYVFNKKVWFGKSAFTDYKMLFFNSFIKILFIGPFLIYGLYFAFYFNEELLYYFGKSTLQLSQSQTIVFYTIALTMCNDLASFIIHFFMHKIPVLWQFHKVHHSATELNPLTQYRLHPLELIINNARGILVFGLVTGFFDYISQNQIDKLLFLGVNVFGFVFLFFGANLRHSHVKLKYPRVVEYFLLVPCNIKFTTVKIVTILTKTLDRN